jgi:hypothetical protein
MLPITTWIFGWKPMETQGTRFELDILSTILAGGFLQNRFEGIASDSSFRNSQAYPRKPKALEHYSDKQDAFAHSSHSKDDDFSHFFSSISLINICQQYIKQISSLLSSATHYYLLDFHELPSFLKHNKYILTKYRRACSYAECWASIFKIHNETINVWSHLLGTLWLLYLGMVMFYSFSRKAQLGDYMIFGWFFVCAIKCFINSALYHIFQCHSP